MIMPTKGCFTSFHSQIDDEQLSLHYNRLTTTSKLLDINFDWTFNQLKTEVMKFEQNQKVTLKVINQSGTISIESRKYVFKDNLILKTVSKPKWWQNLKLFPNNNQLKLLAEAKEHGYDDYLLLDNNLVLETTIANFFYFKDNRLYTPKLNSGILAGTTRQQIIDNFPVTIVDVTVNDIYGADGAFICNAVKGVQMIQAVDDINFNISSEQTTIITLIRQEIEEKL